jgi:hypothetical protein
MHCKTLRSQDYIVRKKENICFIVKRDFYGAVLKMEHHVTRDRLLAVSPIYPDGTKIQPLFKYSYKNCIDKDNIEDIKTTKLHM